MVMVNLTTKHLIPVSLKTQIKFFSKNNFKGGLKPFRDLFYQIWYFSKFGTH